MGGCVNSVPNTDEGEGLQNGWALNSVPEGVGADVGLLDEGHAEADEAGALARDVDAVGGEEGDAVEGELELGLGVAVDQGREAGGHSPEDDKLANASYSTEVGQVDWDFT